MATTASRPGDGGIFGFLALLSTFLVGTRMYTHAWLSSWVASSLLPLAEFSIAAFLCSRLSASRSVMFLVLFERLPNRPMHLRQAFPGHYSTALSGRRRAGCLRASSLLQLPPGLWLDRGRGGPDDLGVHFLGDHAFWRPGVPLALSNLGSQASRPGGWPLQARMNTRTVSLDSEGGVLEAVEKRLSTVILSASEESR